jgi:hypothetical protein
MTNRRLEVAIISAAVAIAVGASACSSKPRVEGAVAPPTNGAIVGSAVVVAAPIVGTPVSAPSAQGQSLSAQPGLWKIEATSGYLRVPMNQCLTAQDMADPQRVAKVFGHPFDPMSNHQPDPGYHTMVQQSQQSCQYNEINQTSDSLTYKYSCKGAFDSTEDGSLKFDSPTHYSGIFNFAGDDKTSVQPSSPTISTEGSRIGDCSDSSF